MNPETLAASVLLWDGKMVRAIAEENPESLFGEPLEAEVHFIRFAAPFEEFKETVKKVAKWDPERRLWVAKPRLREYETVLEVYESLSKWGSKLKLVLEDMEFIVKPDPSHVDEAYYLGFDILNTLREQMWRPFWFSTKKNKVLFTKLVQVVPYYRGSFCCQPFARFRKDLSEMIKENAEDSLALLAAARVNRDEEVIFEGNYAYVSVDEDELEALYDKLSVYEDCDVTSPELERLRRDNSLSYCEYHWVNVGGEMVREGVLKKAYDVVEEGDKTYLKVYRGLLVRALRLLEKGLVPSYANLPKEPKAEFLRDYQKEAVEQALAFLSVQGAATIQAATGAGKTEMAVAVAKTLLESGMVKKVFFLSLNRTLNIQAVNRFRKYGIDAGLVDSENFQIDKPVVACTVQTLYRSLLKLGKAREFKEDIEEREMDYVELGVDKAEKLYKEFVEAGLIIVDEVQHVPARTVSEVIKNSPWSLRLGLSATPWRDDGKDIMIYALIGEVVPRRITSSELISKGYLVPVKIIMVKRKAKIEGVDEGVVGAKRYVAIKNKIFYDNKRNEEIAELVKAAPKPVLILVKEIKHAEELNKKLKEVGLSSAVLTGKEPSSRREAVLRLVAEGKLDAVVATTLADEGLDLPPLRTLVLAAGGRSQTRTLQRVGRVTRPYPGKEVGLVIDIWDDDREAGGVFYRQGLARKELYSSEPAWEVKVMDYKKALKYLGNVKK